MPRVSVVMATYNWSTVLPYSIGSDARPAFLVIPIGVWHGRTSNFELPPLSKLVIEVRNMRVTVPHRTDKDTARRKINERIAQLFGQYAHYLSESSHQWDGDRLVFSGSAKGFKTNGTVEVTETEVIVDGKLPLMAKPFEPRIKSTIEREAEAMFA